MSLPTTIWGNTYDIYTTVPGPTASSPNSSDGPVLGDHCILADGTMVQFLKFVGATNAANAAMIASGSFSTYSITPSTATSQLVIAVNDLSGGSATTPHSAATGAAVTQNYCAWATRRGLSFPLVIATTAANAVVAPSATAGTLDTAVAATHLQGSIANLVVVGGSNAASPCIML